MRTVREEREAFARCRHPAMRSDYLRMCFVLAEGGLYVDADDVLLGDGWKHIFRDGRLKVQPLCYDITSSGMVPAAEIWRADLPTDGRIFYVNNDPIAAPADHPVLRRALARATDRLLGEDRLPEIQSTTGPGNLTAALAAHARELEARRALPSTSNCCTTGRRSRKRVGTSPTAATTATGATWTAAEVQEPQQDDR